MTDDQRTCPTCHEALAAVDHEGVELDRCVAGHGFWLDRGELREVVASEAADRPEAEERAALDAAAVGGLRAVMADAARPARACPVCGASMRLTEYAGSGIPIDECGEHGTWLDAGELERIEAFAEGMRRTLTVGPRAATAAVIGVEIPEALLTTLRAAGPAS